MQTIKKYANRKLYHVNRKQYITLEGIAQLVQNGEQVQVIDNETGEDITVPILAQIVLQTRGRHTNNRVLSTSVLTGLIQFGGERLAGWLRALFASPGGKAIIDLEIRQRLDQLVADGMLSAEEDTRLRGLLLRGTLSERTGEDLVAHETEVPSRNDVVRLHAQVDALIEVIEQLLHQRGYTMPDEVNTTRGNCESSSNNAT